MLDCHLPGDTPMSEPILAYWHCGNWEQIAVQFESKYNTICTRKTNKTIIWEKGAILFQCIDFARLCDKFSSRETNVVGLDNAFCSQSLIIINWGPVNYIKTFG